MTKNSGPNVCLLTVGSGFRFGVGFTLGAFVMTTLLYVIGILGGIGLLAGLGEAMQKESPGGSRSAAAAPR